jgi:RNA polymerase sigma-70 factor, ECF subfamily
MNRISVAALQVPIETAKPDEQALARAAHRDPAAFARLYREYLRPVYSYTLVRVGNCEEAEDLTSQTFLAALQGIDRFRGQSTFSTWLFGIARNKCADYFRQHYRASREIEIDFAEKVPAPDPQMDDLVEQQARLEELARKTRQLPPDEAEALSLRIFGGLNAAEVGQVMGKSQSAVKMLVLRAARTLRPRLEHWTEAE